MLDFHLAPLNVAAATAGVLVAVAVSIVVCIRTSQLCRYITDQRLTFRLAIRAWKFFSLELETRVATDGTNGDATINIAAPGPLVPKSVHAHTNVASHTLRELPPQTE